jgi:hypothetical protein
MPDQENDDVAKTESSDEVIGPPEETTTTGQFSFQLGGGGHAK